MRRFFKRHAGIVLSIVLVVISLQFSIKGRSPVPPVKGVFWAISAVTFPVVSLLTKTKEKVREFVDDYLFLAGVAKENRRLREELARSRARVRQLLTLNKENEQFKAILGYGKKEKRRGVAARVISYDLSPWSNGFFLDAGENDGIRKGMAVVVPQGVAGKVYRVYPGSSFVISIIDHRFSVDARIERTRLRCILKGTGSGCRLKYVRETDDVKKEDRVVTTGFEGSFPPGITGGIVGAVENVEGSIFKNVVLIPFVDLRKLETVYVLEMYPRSTISGRKK